MNRLGNVGRAIMLGAGVLATAAGGVRQAYAQERQSVETQAPLTIGETIADESKALQLGTSLYAQLLKNNPGLVERLKDYRISVKDVRFGPRNDMQSYMALVVHRKEVDIHRLSLTVVGRSMISPRTIQERDYWNGVLAVIPVEMGMTYERFRTLYNSFVVKLRAEQ